MAPSSFSASTGSTQGMKLRMRPPNSATASIGKSAARSTAGDPSTGVTTASIARPPSTRVTVSFLPGSAASAARVPLALSRSTASPGPAPATVRGAPKTTAPAPSMKASGATSGGSLLTASSSRAGPARPPGGARDRDARASAVARHLGRIARDEGAEAGRARRRRTGRQIERQRRPVGNADLAAGQVVEAQAQRQGRARLIKPRDDRQDDRAGIADRLEAEHREALRRRPFDLRRFQVARARPIEPRRIAGIAGRAPINLPMRLEAKFEAELDLIVGSDRGLRGKEPHLALLGLEPGRGGRLGARGQSGGQNHRRHRCAEPSCAARNHASPPAEPAEQPIRTVQPCRDHPAHIVIHRRPDRENPGL